MLRLHTLRTHTLRTLAALCLQATLFGVATAAPIVFDKTQAVSGPRSDAGTGLCGSVTHFAAGQPLASKTDAVAILEKPSNDATVLGRTARLFDSVNFRNGQLNTGGDFMAPTYPDAVFPFSKEVSANPMGTDSNFTMRLRGYFNVPTTLAGKTISFGINCDDYCALRIGNVDLMPPGNQLISGRVIKQVSFKDAGLYAIELVYFQNGSTAYLEWARSDTAIDECPNDICQDALTNDMKYKGGFKLLQAAELYNSVVGTSAACQECGKTGVSCAAASYCGDGLCQSCNSADHCGASCVACPANARMCTSGKCVACSTDAQCGSGMTCDGSGACVSPTVPPMDRLAGGGGCTLGGRATAAGGGLGAGLLLALALCGLWTQTRSQRAKLR